MTGEGRFVIDGCIEVSRETVANMHRRDKGRFRPFLSNYDPMRMFYKVPADECPRRLRSLAYATGERDAQREFHNKVEHEMMLLAMAVRDSIKGEQS